MSKKYYQRRFPISVSEVSRDGMYIYTCVCVYWLVPGAAARWHSARQQEGGLGAHCRVDHRKMMSAPTRDGVLRSGFCCGSLVRR